MTTTSPTSIVRNGSDFDGYINGVLVFTDTNKIEVERVLASLVYTDVAPAEPIAATICANCCNDGGACAVCNDMPLTEWASKYDCTNAAQPIAALDKSIVYDRESRDYALCLNAQIVGFARTFHEAEATLDALVYELLRDEAVVSADEQAERDATRYGICDEPTINENTGRTEPCGVRFAILVDADAIVYCPLCGSSAIIEEGTLAWREARELGRDADDSPGGDRGARDAARLAGYSWRAA